MGTGVIKGLESFLYRDTMKILELLSLERMKGVCQSLGFIAQEWRGGQADRLCANPDSRDFPGRPVVETPCFHCRGHAFDPWLGHQDPACLAAWPGKKKS